MSARFVTLGCGRRVSLGVYVAAWKTALAAPDNAMFRGSPSHSRESADRDTVLREFRFGLHDRINRHIPHHGKGRKWNPDYQAEIRRAAHALNTPRLRIYWLPASLKSRFAHRITTRDDE